MSHSNEITYSKVMTRFKKLIRVSNLVIKVLFIIVVIQNATSFFQGKHDLVMWDVTLFAFGYLVIVTILEWLIFGRTFWNFSDEQKTQNSVLYVFTVVIYVTFIYNSHMFGTLVDAFGKLISVAIILSPLVFHWIYVGYRDAD